MYGRRLIFVIIALVAAFFLFLVLFFFLYPVFNPDTDFDSLYKSEEYLYDYMAFGPAAVAGMRLKIEKLEAELLDRRNKEQKDILLIDSLYTALVNKDEVIAELERKQTATMASGRALASVSAQDAKVTEVIKSLSGLDEEELAPILNRLTDRQLIELYRFSTRMQREKLFRSLDPLRASKIVGSVMS